MPTKEELIDILRMLDDARYEYSKDGLYSEKGQELLNTASHELRKMIVDYKCRKEMKECSFRKLVLKAKNY